MQKIIQKLYTKRLLYAACFILFMLIDWTRGSQIGVVWAWTVNMTGIVMALIIFSSLKSGELRRKEYLVYTVLCAVALPLSYLWWQCHQAVIYRDKLLSAVLNVWVLGILLIRAGKEMAGRIRRKETVLRRPALWQILGGLMLLWMFFSRNEDVWPLWYLMLFGLFYAADFSEQDKKLLLLGALDGILAGFFLLQGAAFVFRPYDDPSHRYLGIYGNANMNALFYCIVLTAFLIRLHLIRINHGSKMKAALCFLMTGGVGGFLILTVSKTAWIAALLIGAAFVFLAELKQLRLKANKVVLHIVVMLLLVIIAIPVDYGIARYLPPIFHHPVWFDGEYSEERVHSWDPWNSDKYVSFSDAITGISERIGPYLELIGEKLTVHAQELTSTGEQTVPKENTDVKVERDSRFDSSTGRILIWKYYLQGGKLWGHSSRDGHGESLGWYVWHAQNMFIQLWYYYGIPSALLFAACLLVLLILAVQRSWKQDDEQALAAALFFLLFLLYGLVEATWYPGQMILLLAFFMPKYIQNKEKKQCRNDEKLNGEAAVCIDMAD